MLEEDLDVGMVLHAILHDLGGAQVGLANHEIDLLAEVGQVEGVLTGGVATTDNGRDLLAIEETIADGAGRDTLAGILLLVVETEILGGGSRGDDDRVGRHLRAISELHAVGTLGEIATLHLAVADVGTETLSLLSKLEHHLVGIDSLGIAGEVFDLGGLGELATRQRATVEHRLERSTTRIEGGSVAGGAASDDKHLDVLHLICLFCHYCILCFSCTRLFLEPLLDLLGDEAKLGGGLEAGNNLTLLVDEELGEVPLDVGLRLVVGVGG